MSVIAPTRSSAQRTRTRIPVLTVVGRGDVERVEQGSVGAVEGDQHERERPVERLALDRLAAPRSTR